MGAKDFHALLSDLHIAYKNDSLYRAAFTHVSYRNEHQDSCLADYDRLEFIGDGVLDLVVADFLYHRFPEMDSGSLSKVRASLVRGATLCSFSKKMHFEDYILVSKGEQNSGPMSNNILEDCFESFIGAFYLDNHEDFIKTRSLVYSFFADPIENYEEYETFDYKSRLQEIIQADVKGDIVYNTISETGTSNDKNFKVEVSLDGLVLGSGEGTSKKRAEQQAAKNAIEKRIS